MTDPREQPPGNRDLRPGTDPCYKCGTCDASCPVADVDEDFPGPKFQGPEQWRLTRGSDRDVDPSIMACSNCMRCDGACPASVPLSQLHNTARGQYVTNQQSAFSRPAIRNRLLANYRRGAALAARFPRLANAVANNRLLRWAMDRGLGITADRELPTFATQTFRSWWEDRGGADASRERAARNCEDDPPVVAYFHGCYTNYHTVEVGKALVGLYESFGYAVTVPPQACSGTPMFANGRLDDAKREHERTLAGFRDAIADGAPILTSCTSCSMALRQEHPELFDLAGIDELAGNTWDALEYLRVHEDLADRLAAATPEESSTYVYHAPCHARNQGLARQARELLADVSGVTVTDVGDSCSGISGTYGWKAEHYGHSMAIGEPMFEHMETAPGDTGLTECPTCAMQMEHGTGYEVEHPIVVVADVLGCGLADGAYEITERSG